MLERFEKIVNGLKPLTIFAKRSILDVWQGSGYASGVKSSEAQKASIFTKIVINKLSINENLLISFQSLDYLLIERLV